MKVEMITGQKDFKRLRPVWNRLVDESETPSVFLTHEWYSAWWANLSAGRQLYIILIKEENGTLTGIAPCCRAEGRLQFMADKDVTDYCDIIVKKGHSAACLDALFSCFRQEIVQDMEVFFVNIPDSSPTVSFLPGAAAQNGFIYRKSQIESAPWLYLPDSVSDYLQSLDRKARHEVKRKTRRIEKESSLRLEYITEPGRIEQVMPDFIRLHENCGADKRSFWMKTGMKAFFRTMAFGLSSRNMAEMNLLYLNDTLIGALFNFIYAEKKYISIMRHIIRNMPSTVRESTCFIPGLKAQLKPDF